MGGLRRNRTLVDPAGGRHRLGPSASGRPDVSANREYLPRRRCPYESSPPFDRPDRWSYQRFFASGDQQVAAGRRAVHEPPARPRHFAEGISENYIAQHPPVRGDARTGLPRDPSHEPRRPVLRPSAVRVHARVARARHGRSHGRAERAGRHAWRCVRRPRGRSSCRPGTRRWRGSGTIHLLRSSWLRCGRGWSPDAPTPSPAPSSEACLGAGALTKAFFIPIAAGTLAWIAFRAIVDGTRPGTAMFRSRCRPRSCSPSPAGGTGTICGCRGRIGGASTRCDGRSGLRTGGALQSRWMV